jgi:3-methyladenine DNA glycosylase AlkD
MAEGDSFLVDLPEFPDAGEIIKALEAAFLRFGKDPQYLEGLRRTVPGADMLYGVRVPSLRKMSKEVIDRVRKEKKSVLEIAERCWAGGSREHQLVALFMLAGIRLDPSERWEMGVKLLPDVNNWESCDQLCMALLGQALAEDPHYMDVLETWLEDENVWMRRAALGAPVYLRRANYPSEIALDLDCRTLAMSAVLIDDGENYIRKVVDWTVREVIERHYDLGFQWLIDQAKSRTSKVARSTLRLASKKLTGEDQEAFLAVLEANAT